MGAHFCEMLGNPSVPLKDRTCESLSPRGPAIRSAISI
jgi:hypothetical protein